MATSRSGHRDGGGRSPVVCVDQRPLWLWNGPLPRRLLINVVSVPALRSKRLNPYKCIQRSHHLRRLRVADPRPVGMVADLSTLLHYLLGSDHHDMNVLSYVIDQQHAVGGWVR